MAADTLVLRARTRTGMLRIDAKRSWTKSELHGVLASSAGIDSERLRVLGGYPPAPIDLENGAPLGDSFRPGDVLIVEETKKSAAAEPGPEAAPKEQGTPVVATLVPALAAPAPAPAAPVPAPASPVPAPASPVPAPAGSADAAASSHSIALDADFVRRVVPDDNSCLFRAVSCVLGQGHAVEHLRRVVAEAIRRSPKFYNEATLGRTNEEYGRWITGENAWGGAIELSILADEFKTELAAFDIKTSRMDCYGEGNGYELRGYLLYDGIHYDALALALGGEGTRELDVTLFGTGDSVATTKARAVAVAAQQRKAYTDTQNFKLRCGDCGAVVYGENGALEHSRRSGHSNYAEG